MAMTSEVKTGLMVSGAFASLVGAVLTKHYVSPDELLGHKPPTEQVATAEGGEGKAAEGTEGGTSAASANPSATEPKGDVVLASASGTDKNASPPPTPNPADLIPPPPSPSSAGDGNSTLPPPPPAAGTGDKPMDGPPPPAPAPAGDATASAPPPPVPGGLPPLEEKKSAETLAPLPPPGGTPAAGTPPDPAKLAEGLLPPPPPASGSTPPAPAITPTTPPDPAKLAETLVPPAPAAGGLAPPAPPAPGSATAMPDLTKPGETPLGSGGPGGLTPPAPPPPAGGPGSTTPLPDLTKVAESPTPPQPAAGGLATPMAPSPTTGSGLGGFAPPVPPPSAGSDLSSSGTRGLGVGAGTAAGGLALSSETFPTDPGKPGIARVLTFPIGTGPEKRSESIPLDEPGFPAARLAGGAPPLATGGTIPGGSPSLATTGTGEAGGLPPSGMPGNLSVRPTDSRPAAFVPVDGKNIPVLTMPAGPGQPMPITPGTIPLPPSGTAAPVSPNGVGRPAVGPTAGAAGAPTSLNTSVNGLNTQMNNTVNGLGTSLNEASRNLNTTANNLNNQTNSAIGGLSNQLNGGASNLNNAVNGLNNSLNTASNNLNNTVNGALNSASGAVSSWTEHPYKVQAGDSWEKISQAQYGTTLYASTLKTFNQTHPRGGETLAKDGSPVAGQEVYLLPLDQVRKLTSAPR